MSEAKVGDKVKVNYTGKLEDGTVFDSSVERGPLEFTLGSAKIIPGFEQAVVGMLLGETKKVEIPPEQGYGEPKPEMIVQVDRAKVPADIELQVGQRLELNDPQGGRFPATVCEISDNSVTLDANHPLAGKVLTFELELMEVS